MDRLIYTAMAGAKHVLERQATTANNIANVSTAGFRVQIDAFRAMPIEGEGLPTRVAVVDATVGADFTAGALQQTGNDLDVAIRGSGWLAVQDAGGSEAYTRAGSLKINENGLLQTQAGMNVLGEGGPISVPPDTKVAIGQDGTVSAIPLYGKADVNVLGKLKLVNPAEASLERRADGLFRVRDGSTADADSAVTLVPGAVEGSNVNPFKEMIDLIGQSRQFDAQMKLLQTAESNDTKATQILSLA